MFFKRKLLLEKITDQLTKQKKMIVLYVIWCTVCIVWREYMTLQAYNSLYHLNISMADMLVLMQGNFEMGILIVPITMLVGLKCKQGSIQTQQIIRYKSKSCFYRWQIVESMVYALLVAGMLLAIESLTAYTMGLPWINWDNMGSLFFSVTKQVVDEKFVVIFFGVFVMHLLKFMMNFLVLEIILWKPRYMPFFWILLLLQAGIENEGESIKIFHRLFSIQYSLWMTPKLHVLIFLGGLVCCIGIYVVGKKVFQKQDIFK